jgi:hypothetical protein
VVVNCDGHCGGQLIVVVSQLWWLIVVVNCGS